MVWANPQLALNRADMMEVSLWRSGLAYFSVSFLWTVCSLCPDSPGLQAGSGLTPLPLLVPIAQALLPGDFLMEGQSAALRACKAPTSVILTRHRAVFLIKQSKVVLYETLNSHWFYSELNNQALCKPPGHLCTSKNLSLLGLWLKITFSEVFSCVMR